MGLGTITFLGMLCAPGQVPADVTPWATPSMKIPIDYHPSKRAEIRELLLYVSPDQGQTWQSAAVATPDKDTQFNFNAPADGIYWFNMVVVDKSGRRDPADVFKAAPALKVLFDTKKPVVSLTGAQRTGDDVTVSWKIAEKNPDWAKFKLEYSTNGATWSTVQTRPEAEGSAQFKVTGAAAITVRLNVVDMVGHIGEAISPVAGTTTVAKPETNNVIAAGGPGELPPPPPPMIPPAAPIGGTAGFVPAPGVAAPTGPAPGTTLTDRARELRTDPRGNDTPAPPISAFPPAPGSVGAPMIPAIEPSTNVAVPSVPVTRDTVGVSPPASSAYLPPAQTINVTSFKLSYEVEERGASGVGRADVWVTRDEGRTWRPWQTFEKPDSPLTVNLAKGGPSEPAEGVFGLKVLLQSGAGLSRETPKSGDAPDLRIEVDITPPTVKIFEPVADPTQKDTMVLRWQAVDKNLTADPITLEWSDSPRGPWLPVVADAGIGSSGPGTARRLPNTGNFPWKLPSNFPTHKVYLKITARDLAGNVSEATTSQPILVDLNKPVAVKLNILGGSK